MKLLLTSGGVSNATLRNTLVDLLGKPIEACAALCIPTAAHALKRGPEIAWRQISGHDATPLCDLGWKSLGVLELTALPSLDPAQWEPHVRAADALLVGGGDPLYLCHWMRQSGLADLFPDLHDTVYVGVSAGSMVMAPRIGEDFARWRPPGGGDRTLGRVDFSIFPHVDHPMLPDNAMRFAEAWAADIGGPCYALDDQSAIAVS
ncbi:MAG: Type 1 glutamine amidotransferase-like domain-containing protein, partial [Thermoflexales bacterium]|nr:Type 1 glutamine amidotransferase-like domain-containing protein [Thermoflexales bacterium]